MHANLTNSLQYTDDGSEVANVEDRQGQLYVPVVSHTLRQPQSTGVTVCIFLVCTLKPDIFLYSCQAKDEGAAKYICNSTYHSPIKHTIWSWHPLSILSVQVLSDHLDVSCLLDGRGTVHIERYMGTKTSKTCLEN